MFISGGHILFWRAWGCEAFQIAAIELVDVWIRD
jgi:hypothetical protein